MGFNDVGGTVQTRNNIPILNIQTMGFTLSTFIQHCRHIKIFDERYRRKVLYTGESGMSLLGIEEWKNIRNSNESGSPLNF
jgi:hypothetical protein